jgi:putative ABC transport system permease protein
MASLREWTGRLRETFRPKRDDSDLEQELRLHSALAAEQAVRAGHTPDQARSHFPYRIVIWAPDNPPDFEKQVTKALADFDVPMYDIQSYSEVIRADYAQQSLLASLTWLFAALGLVLAAVGLYGVTGYGVEQRTNEIGVRVALGADRGQVLMMVLRGALWPVGIGLAIGVPAAIAVDPMVALRWE